MAISKEGILYTGDKEYLKDTVDLQGSCFFRPAQVWHQAERLPDIPR